MSGAEADVHINTRPSSVNAKDAHRIIPTPVHLTAPPQVEPQLHFSQDSASLLTSSWNLAALWLGWSGLPATSQLSQTLDPRPTLPVTGSSPRDCPEQYFCFVLFLPGLTRQHRGKVVMFYFGISLICSRWLKEFLFFKIQLSQGETFHFYVWSSVGNRGFPGSAGVSWGTLSETLSRLASCPATAFHPSLTAFSH